MAIFVNRTVANLQHDAETINQIGIIRGSIQRLTKLELYHDRVSSDTLIQGVDQLLGQFVRKMETHPQRTREREVNFHIRKTAEKWLELKKALAEYRRTPSPRILQALIEISEQCWKTADVAVLAAQHLTEQKIGGIRFFYVVLTVNAANVLIVLWIVYVYVRNKIEYQATHDSLTRLLNRYSFEKEVQDEIFRCKRYDRIFSLIIFDIDYFKKVNDRYGHKAGDRVLVSLGTLVKGMMRKTDKVFRIGGEEFAILASETTGINAMNMAEKIRREVENHPFGLDEKVTISLGISESRSDDTIDDIFRDADAALYLAKENGRNRARLFSGK